MTQLTSFRSLVILICSLVFTACLVDNCRAFDNLLVNGGFEVPSQFSIYPGTEPAGFGWTVTSGDIEAFNDSLAFEGGRLTDTTGSSPGHFHQTFATTPGVAYSLMFAYSNNPTWPPATLAFSVRGEQSGVELLASSVFHGTATLTNYDWNFQSPIVFIADGSSTRLSFRSLAGGAGGVTLDDVTVFEGKSRTPGSVPVYAAKPGDDAFYLNQSVAAIPGGQGTTVKYRNLDLLGDSTYELLSLDTLQLDDGNGTLYIGPHATFIGNGVIRGNVLNAGLTIIPITKVAGSLPLIQTPPSERGGTAVVQRPMVPLLEVVSVIPPQGELVVQSRGGVFFGGSGGGFVGASESTPAVAPRWEIGDATPVVNEGTFGWDGSLGVTGSYTQTETGITRFYIAGDEQGISYSQLAVGEQVTLDGTLQIVLNPSLFGSVPQVGDHFDIVTSDVGIAVADGLRIDTLVMANGATQLDGVFDPLLAYDSGFGGDPDELLDIVPDIFEYSLVDNGRTLRVTLVRSAVPEPASVVGLSGCVAAALACHMLGDRGKLAAARLKPTASRNGGL